MNAAHTSGSFDWRRRNMVQRLAKMGISRADVLAAMGNVPRHVFVEEALRSRAYDDMSLPLGLGQTISQPYTVAVMTQLMLGDAAAETFGPVLEIGTGCGYQTAVLQAVGLKQIYSVERLQALQLQHGPIDRRYAMTDLLADSLGSEKGQTSPLVLRWLPLATARSLLARLLPAR